MLSKTSTTPIVMFIGRPRRWWASQKPFASWRERDWRFYGAGELGPKQLELLREILLTLTRVGHLFDTNVPSSKLEKQLTREAARNLGIAYSLADRSPLARGYPHHRCSLATRHSGPSLWMTGL
jgi:hypothetical protein